MDKNRIASKIGRLERELSLMEANRVSARASALRELDGNIQNIDTHTAANIAGAMSMIIKCNGIISKLEQEIAFLKDLME